VKPSQLVVLVTALVASACSTNNNKATDAPVAIDSHRPVDAAAVVDAVVQDAKVFLDATIPSSVIVVAGCTNVAAGDIAATITTTASDTFNPATATIAAGQYVKFTTAGDHNFQNQPNATAENKFVSAAPGAQTTCLQFTVAGSYPFECVVHASMGMKGTLTVN
jgi:plastocyanin